MKISRLVKIALFLVVGGCWLGGPTLAAQSSARPATATTTKKPPTLLEQVGITARQRKELERVRLSIRDRLLALQAAGKLDADGPDVQALRVEEARLIDAVLTPKQRARLRELKREKAARAMIDE